MSRQITCCITFSLHSATGEPCRCRCEDRGFPVAITTARSIHWIAVSPSTFAIARSVKLKFCTIASAMLEQDPTLTPRDIIVMVADIDSYSPFIQAVCW
ncbi:hypothetical protein ACNKHX_17180 [Shigella flexneri]